MSTVRPSSASHDQRDCAAPLLRVEDLRVEFLLRRGRRLRAVDGVSLEVPRGRTLGLVGESGCGKTTLARAVLRLVPALGGRVWFDGRDVLAARRRELRKLRRGMQIVFQDPAGSLNPRLTVELAVGEALSVHGLVSSRTERRRRVGELLRRVGLREADMDRYPHEFSGGQRQRIGIARALALQPRLVVCDEPVSALDVSIQSQILNLLLDLQAELGLSYLFIAHDLAVVRCFCHEVAVMYLGRIVEQAPTSELFARPLHPYTRALLAAVPRPEPDAMPAGVLIGEPPNPSDPPAGCAFHPRCPQATERCRRERPELVALSSGGAHRVACFEVDGPPAGASAGAACSGRHAGP